MKENGFCFGINRLCRATVQYEGETKKQQGAKISRIAFFTYFREQKQMLWA